MASNSGGSKLGEGEREQSLISSLESLCKEHDRETARKAIETLLTLANNIVRSPTDEKYRKVKKQNKSFSVRVWQLAEAQEFLFSWGWQEDDDHIVLPSDEDVQLVKQILMKKLNNIPSRSSSGVASNSEPLTERERQLQEERRKVLEKKKFEDQEKARIKAQIQADRKNIKDREMRESRARKPEKFGGKITKFGDIGVDLNKGGG
ncbi:peptide-N(4)-(N-acetyl-beta-glucosaminyl)asparagine amidase [Pocillopora verrucosa]|uniref:peptide-N(4)-(N-acetyl-beta- glucosaminyl)asparagine amidase n=1 Tax=Pocillopora verrucosa TaxID=203993 RepID=UPI00333FDFFD